MTMVSTVSTAVSNLQEFHNDQFGNVRIIQENGKPFFCGADVAKALGYSNPRDALRRHCKGGVKRDTLTNGGNQTIMYIPEGDVYRLITHSKLPSAQQFESWVFDDVLPTIRKHGVYASLETAEKLLGDPDFAIATFTALKKEKELNKALTETINVQQKQIANMKPKATYCDIVLNCKETVPISVVAKDYGWSARRMNKWLYEHNIQYKQGSIWLLYQDYSSCGYTQTKTRTFHKKDGEDVISVQTQWTQKGRMFLYELLKKNHILPLIEQSKTA